MSEVTLNDDELVEKCEKLINGLCQKGMKEFRMSIPPRPNEDSDFLIHELIDRFNSLRGTQDG